MKRFALVALLVSLAALTRSSARADLPVAPAPREVRPDGSRDPVPQAEPPVKGENPAVTVERIIKNSKTVGDKLEQKDTGTDTRNTQRKILSDIDALLNQQENPPPPKPDQDKNDKNDKNDMSDKSDMNDQKGMSDKKDDSKDGKDTKGKNGGTPKNDMPMGKDGMDQSPMPKDGMGAGMSDSQPTGERRPRMGQPKDDSKEPSGNAKQPGKSGSDQQGKASKQPKASKDPNAKGAPGGKVAGNPMGKVTGKPLLPFEEEDASKDVWGHLPDKLRRQMSQYYKDEFAPKYAELLRLYYSSLADKNAKPAEPRK